LFYRVPSNWVAKMVAVCLDKKAPDVIARAQAKDSQLRWE